VYVQCRFIAVYDRYRLSAVLSIVIANRSTAAMWLQLHFQFKLPVSNCVFVIRIANDVATFIILAADK